MKRKHEAAEARERENDAKWRKLWADAQNSCAFYARSYDAILAAIAVVCEAWPIKASDERIPRKLWAPLVRLVKARAE